MTRDTFEALCNQLAPEFARQDTHLRRCVPLDKRVAMCVYALSSSAELRTVANLFGVGESTLRTAVHEFCELVVQIIMPSMISFPTTEGKMRDIIKGFLDDWQFPQTYGALDGCHIGVEPPKEYAADYYCYKHKYSTVLLAMCDSGCRFIYVNVGAPGRNNDANVYGRSSLPTLIAAHPMLDSLTSSIDGRNIQPLILGDGAFPLSPNLMKPYADGPVFNQQQRVFNYHLSRARRVIENAFGRLKARYRCLVKNLAYHIDRVPVIVQTCCTLHNLCEELGDTCEREWLDELPHEDPDGRVCIQEIDRIEANAIRNHLAAHFVRLAEEA